MTQGLEFSVVVPFRGRLGEIEHCLRALARLDFPRARFEVILVNDGGAEPDAALLARYQSALQLSLLTQPRSGPAAARNFGAAHARGHWLAFTDSDCRPRPCWLPALQRALAAHSGVAAAGGPLLNAAPGMAAAVSQRLLEQFLRASNSGPAGITFLPTANLAVPRDAFLAAGGFDASFPLAAGEDREFCRRWLRLGHSFLSAPEAVVDHHHAMGPAGLLRQQFNYGRGARLYHAEPLSSSSTLQRIHTALATRAQGGSPLAHLLRLAAQAAIACGYILPPPSRAARHHWLRRMRDLYVKHIRPALPAPVLAAAIRAYSLYVRFRLGPTATRLFGPRFTRNPRRLDIDITWACNLNCFDCNRSCRQAPTGDHMTPAQIRRFLEESAARGYQWEQLNIVGGEPTLHPQFRQILDLLLDYQRRHAPSTRIKLSTNGHGDRVNAILQTIPPQVHVVNTFKTGPEQPEFTPFNLAPADTPFYRGADFRNACALARDCGTGLTPLGYYPCPVAGGIDRIFGFNLARHELPEPGDRMHAELERFCRVCGFFRMNLSAPAQTQGLISPAWLIAYEQWRKQPPRLPRFPEAGSEE